MNSLHTEDKFAFTVMLLKTYIVFCCRGQCLQLLMRTEDHVEDYFGPDWHLHFATSDDWGTTSQIMVQMKSQALYSPPNLKLNTVTHNHQFNFDTYLNPRRTKKPMLNFGNYHGADVALKSTVRVYSTSSIQNMEFEKLCNGSSDLNGLLKLVFCTIIRSLLCKLLLCVAFSTNWSKK